jgi:hypothetical protein
LAGGWVNDPGPKTGIARRCPLWTETLEAIRQALDARPKTKDPKDALAARRAPACVGTRSVMIRSPLFPSTCQTMPASVMKQVFRTDQPAV